MANLKNGKYTALWVTISTALVVSGAILILIGVFYKKENSELSIGNALKYNIEEQQWKTKLAKSRSYCFNRDRLHSQRGTYTTSNHESWSKSRMDVDLVYTWVGGNCTEFLRLKKKYQKECLPSSEKLSASEKSATSAKRFVDHKELYYSLHSVKNYVPWINNIYIVTGFKQRPFWLDGLLEDEPFLRNRIKFVDHKDIIPEIYLPTFNSHVIEAHIYKIPDLSEHFIYLNDDVFFGNQCAVDDFFDTSNRLVCPIKELGGPVDLLGKNLNKLEAYSHAWKNLQSLLQPYFKDNKIYHLCHMTVPLTKSIMQDAEKNFQSYWDQTKSHKFRHVTDIPPIGFSVRWGEVKGQLVRKEIKTKFYQSFNTRIMKELLSSRPQLFCINETDIGLHKFFEMYFNKTN